MSSKQFYVNYDFNGAQETEMQEQSILFTTS